MAEYLELGGGSGRFIVIFPKFRADGSQQPRIWSLGINYWIKCQTGANTIDKLLVIDEAETVLIHILIFHFFPHGLSGITLQHLLRVINLAWELLLLSLARYIGSLKNPGTPMPITAAAAGRQAGRQT